VYTTAAAAMADDSGWLERKCASHLAKKGWVCVKNAEGSAEQFFAAKRVGVDQQRSVGASTMMKMEHADKATAADKGQRRRLGVDVEAIITPPGIFVWIITNEINIYKVLLELL
jgi:hypothetical protein